MSIFYENYVSLCVRFGKTPTKVALEIGLNRAAPTSWKSGTIPRDATLKKIADYFGISPAELRDGPLPADKPTEAPPPVNQEISGILAELTPEELEKVAAFAQGLIAARGKQPPRRP